MFSFLLHILFVLWEYTLEVALCTAKWYDIYTVKNVSRSKIYFLSETKFYNFRCLVVRKMEYKCVCIKKI